MAPNRSPSNTTNMSDVRTAQHILAETSNSTVISNIVSFDIPVELKEATAPDPKSTRCTYAWCSDLEPPLFVGVEPRTPKEMEVMHHIQLGILNRYFATMTGQIDTAVQMEYYPSTDRIADHSMTNSRMLCSTFPGFEIATKMRPITDKKTGVIQGYEVSRRSELLQWWLKHPGRRTFIKIGFHPNEQAKADRPGDFNVFGGLPFDHLECPEGGPDMELVDPVLDHIRLILAAGDDAHFSYQINWYASGMQWRRRLDVVMIYVGEQGAGKDLLIGDDGLMALIYGKYHIKFSSMESFLDKFNLDAFAKLFIVLDEVTPYNKSHRNNDKFKDRATAKTFRVQPKFVNAYHVQDHSNTTSTTNHDNGYKYEDGERRQYTSKVDNKHSKKSENAGTTTAEERLRYFARVMGARVAPDQPARRATPAETLEVAKHVFWYLMRVDLTGFNPQDFPTCELREEQMSMNACPVGEFLQAWHDGDLGLVGTLNEPINSWAHDCKVPWRATQIKEKFDRYLELQGMDYSESSSKNGASAKHLSHKIQKYPDLVRRLGNTRHSNGILFVLEGHPDFQACA